MGYRERIAKLRAQEEEQDYIWLDREYETYSQNANRFINEVNSYGQRDENQWRNAAALGYAQKARDLQAQGQALQEKYRRAGKQEQAAALGSQLEQFGQMRAALEQDEKYWGQWGSQAAYDQYQADQQEYERIMGIDVQQTVARIETIDDMLMYPGARAVNEAALEEEKKQLEEDLAKRNNIDFYQKYKDMDQQQLQQAVQSLREQLKRETGGERSQVQREDEWLHYYRIWQGKDNNFDGQLVVENIADLERVINGRLLTYEQAKEQEQLIQEKLDDPNRDRMETATLYRLQQGLREYARWIATSDQLQAEEQTMTARFNEISQEREQAAKSEMEPDVYFGLMQQLEGEQLDIWGQTPGIRERRYNVAMQEDFAEMGQELVERIMQIPYWEQDAEQQEKVSETIEQLRKQGYSDEEIKEYIKYARYRRDEAEVAERKEEQIQFAEEHPVWASILSVPAKLVGAVTGTVQSLIDYVGSIGEEGYQAPNRNGMGYILNDFAQTVRGTVSKEIAEQTDWEIFGVNVASWGYETLLGVADFAAATLAGWGNIGTTLTILATERGTERFLQVLDQGGTMEQAFWSGVTTGALDRILNKLPVEKLLGKSSGKVRQTLWKTMKEQGLLQMGSEAAGRVTDIVADTVVMGEQSEYKRLEAQYLKQGLTRKEARRQALLDLAGSVAVSGGSGLVQGAALGSVAQLARRLFQMGNSGAEIEQEQPVQYIDPEQGSLDDNVRNLYAYYREQAQIDSAAKDGIMEAKLEDISQLSLNLNDTDFYVAPNGKILSKKYKEWIGPNKRDDLINSVKDETLKKL